MSAFSAAFTRAVEACERAGYDALREDRDASREEKEADLGRALETLWKWSRWPWRNTTGASEARAACLAALAADAIGAAVREERAACLQIVRGIVPEGAPYATPADWVARVRLAEADICARGGERG